MEVFILRDEERFPNPKRHVFFIFIVITIIIFCGCLFLYQNFNLCKAEDDLKLLEEALHTNTFHSVQPRLSAPLPVRTDPSGFIS